MQAELNKMRTYLSSVSLMTHAKDFFTVRQKKQLNQFTQNPLQYEHTAYSNYIDFHNKNGQRLPIFQRNSHSLRSDFELNKKSVLGSIRHI